MLITGYFLFGREISFSKRVRTAARILYALFFYGILLMLIHWFILARFYPISDYSSYNTIFKPPNWLSGEKPLVSSGIRMLYSGNSSHPETV